VKKIELLVRRNFVKTGHHVYTVLDALSTLVTHKFLTAVCMELMQLLAYVSIKMIMHAPRQCNCKRPGWCNNL
jgi:hypothetical protein